MRCSLMKTTGCWPSKSLTTRHDLTLGIGDALAGLPQEDFSAISLVALSTTLSTNSVVEGKGAPVGVLLPGYRDQQLQKSGLLEIFDKDLVAILPGGHDAVGNEQTPLDEVRVREAIDRLKGRVAAFAVSSMFGVRNPVHEKRVRELVAELSARPVTCGHELASDLDAPRRALTVALNARMIPIIHELIQAVSEILAEKFLQRPRLGRRLDDDKMLAHIKKTSRRSRHGPFVPSILLALQWASETLSSKTRSSMRA